MVNYIIQRIITIINRESVASFSLILLMFKIYSSGTAINTSNTHAHTNLEPEESHCSSTCNRRTEGQALYKQYWEDLVDPYIFLENVEGRIYLCGLPQPPPPAAHIHKWFTFIQ